MHGADEFIAVCQTAEIGQDAVGALPLLPNVSALFEGPTLAHRRPQIAD